MDYGSVLLVMVIGYGFGCIQAAYLIGRIFYKKDIRDYGSKNSGASNATMILGKKSGVITGLIDIVKAIISVTLIKLILGSEQEAILTQLVYLNGLFVILGHNFPFYMGFRGGKGTAALVGLLLAIDWRLGVAAGLVLIIVTLITDYIVLGTVALLVVFALYTMLTGIGWVKIIVAAVIIVMSITRHWANFLKLKNGTETRVLRTLMKKSTN